MGHEAVGSLTGQTCHVAIDATEQDLWRWGGERLRCEERLHSGEAVAGRLEVELRAALPARPDGAQGGDIIAHSRYRGLPLDREAALDVALHLRAEAEAEAAAGRRLQVPRRVGDDHRRARKGEGDAGGHTQTSRVLECQQRGQERVVDRLGDQQAGEAAALDALRVGGDVAQRHARILYGSVDVHGGEP